MGKGREKIGERGEYEENIGLRGGGKEEEEKEEWGIGSRGWEEEKYGKRKRKNRETRIQRKYRTKRRREGRGIKGGTRDEKQDMRGRQLWEEGEQH